MRTEHLVTGLVALLLGAAAGRAQQPAPGTAGPAPVASATPRPAGLSFETNVLFGITVADLEGPQGAGSPSGNVTFGASSRLLVPAGRRLAVGLDVGYQQLARYDSFPGAFLPARHVRLASFHTAALVRFRVGNRLTQEVGAGAHFFSDGGTHPGALLALTWRVPVGGGLEVPIGGRAQVILAHTIMPVLEFGAGLALGSSPPEGRSAAEEPARVERSESVAVTRRDTTIYAGPGVLAYPYLPGTQLEIAGSGGTMLGYPQVPDFVVALRVVIPGHVGSGLGVEVGRHMIATAGLRGFNHVSPFVRLVVLARATVDVGPAFYLNDGGQVRAGGRMALAWHFPIGFGVDAVFGPRADLILINPIAVPVTLAMGAGFRL
jgi:hypothetical protein